MQKSLKRNRARQRIGDNELGYSSSDLDIVLHHEFASPEVSDDEATGLIFVAKLPFRSLEVSKTLPV
jgi:hypothetical protein